MPELGAAYKALSAEASTALGRNPCFTVHDELGQVEVRAASFMRRWKWRRRRRPSR